jgi:hypothetical protein
MTDASLNQIYKLLGELTGDVRAINGKVDDLKTDMSESEATSAHYRQGVRDELGKIVLRTTHLESDMSTVKSNVDRMRGVTDDVEKMRERALGAGTLGRWLIRIGIGVVTFAGWAAAAYTWMFHRPPP